MLGDVGRLARGPACVLPSALEREARRACTPPTIRSPTCRSSRADRARSTGRRGCAGSAPRSPRSAGTRPCRSCSCRTTPCRAASPRGSIHVVTNVARFWRALPSRKSSSWMIWYAVSGSISSSGIRQRGIERSRLPREERVDGDLVGGGVAPVLVAHRSLPGVEPPDDPTGQNAWLERYAPLARQPPGGSSVKKLLLLLVVVALGAAIAKKVRAA